MNTQTQTQIVAQINETNLLANLGQIFSSSYSVLGELMQNARRAGATKVDFTIDVADRFISVADDGCGIGDWQKLVHLSQSGWGQSIQDSDRPFGMGFFSVFFACEKVSVHSMGHRVEMTLADITEKRPIAVVVDDNPLVAESGTLVCLHGISAKLCSGSEWSPVKQIFGELNKRALAFPIPVTVNGMACLRDLAEDVVECLHSEKTAIGVVKVLRPITGLDGHVQRLFLQGLPISDDYFGIRMYGATHTVVYLNEQFVPVMPDRARLQDEKQQVELVVDAVIAVWRNHLLALKKSLSPEEFVSDWFHSATVMGHGDLFDDVPVLSGVCLTRVDSVDQDGCLSTAMWGTFMTKSAIENGEVHVWRNVPNTAEDCGWDAARLQMMAFKDILALSPKANGLTKNHWIHALAHDFKDMTAEVTTGDVQGQNQTYSHDVSVCVKLVGYIELTLMDKKKPDYVLKHRIEDGYLFVPGSAGENGDDSPEQIGMTCYFTSSWSKQGQPWAVYDDFKVDSDYREDWADEAARNWHSLLNGLCGQHLTETIRDALFNGSFRVLPKQESQLALVVADQSKRQHVNVLNLDDLAVWDRMAELMGQGAVGDAPVAQSLKASFMTAIQSAGAH